MSNVCWCGRAECAVREMDEGACLRTALAASQARVAELEAQVATAAMNLSTATNVARERIEWAETRIDELEKHAVVIDDARVHAHDRAEKAEAESAAKDAALNALRVALKGAAHFAEWAHHCEDGREDPKCDVCPVVDAAHAALSLEAVKLAADAQARRDEAVASLGDLLEVLADMDRETHLQKLKWDDRARLRERASVALAKVKP